MSGASGGHGVLVAGVGVVAAAAGLLPTPVGAQMGSELEVERVAGATTSRVEFLGDGFYLMRAERTQGDDAWTDRVGVQLPGSLLALSGHVSLFVEDRPGRLGYGGAFELGQGVLALGGTVQRADQVAFTGGYVRLRGSDVDVGLGGGRTERDWVGHGVFYEKGTRFSVAVGGVAGPGYALQHLSATWHPPVRGTRPGAFFTAERRSEDAWFVEAFATDRADFGYMTSWGAYGMDQWPHTRTFEAVGDVMRYVRPSIMNQDRAAGMGIAGGRIERSGGATVTTVDARVFPVRIVRRLAGNPGWADSDPDGGYLRDQVLPSLMVGAFRNVEGGSATAVGQVRLPPFLVYAEADLGGGEPYLFIQYRVGAPD